MAATGLGSVDVAYRGKSLLMIRTEAHSAYRKPGCPLFCGALQHALRMNPGWVLYVGARLNPLLSVPAPSSLCASARRP